MNKTLELYRLLAVTVVTAVLFGSMVGLIGTSSNVSAALVIPPGTIDPTTIPKWENQLTGPPPVFVPTVVTHGKGNVMRYDYTVDMTEFQQQILPQSMGMTTTVWGYGGEARDALTGQPLGYIRNSPGPTFEATRGIPSQVTWQNEITGGHLFAVDPTLHWADPNNLGMLNPPYNPYPPGYLDAQSPVPLIPHLHGGEVQSTSDGHPEAWFTYDGQQGSAYNTLKGAKSNEAKFYYPNEQPPTTLWYHDHGLGITRINVMSGLAGFYLLRDPTDTVEAVLPTGKWEMPLVFQDRTFKADGNFWFPTVGLDPSVHPYWQPEFFGNTIMVNGLVWPNMNVDQGWYRFRLLDGSNARFYTLTFKVPGNTVPAPPFWVIGSDGGYLKTPAATSVFTIAPGERVDIVVDFSNMPAGTKVILNNKAKTPFPNGATVEPRTTAQIVQFTVQPNEGHMRGLNLIAALPAILNPTLTGPAFPTLPATPITRSLVLWEVMGPLGPTEILLNGQKWAAAVSETPTLGSTEDWIVVNPTADTHPIHLHLTQFQLVSRQKIDTAKYASDWLALQTDANNMPPWTNNYHVAELPIAGYLKGMPSAALPSEQGWKDTVQMNPGEVTIIRVRFSPIDGTVNYPFDATDGPGYVWHCHILDHEDNEMMRPYEVKP